MLPLRAIRTLMMLPILVGALASVRAIAQDDPNEMPLGDVARNLRKKTSPARQVIDDDNLNQVMEQGENHKSFGSSLRYVMAGEIKGFQVSAPDVTCSLSFTANVKALLSSQYTQMDLPAEDLAKLQGPATIEGDALTVTLFNATNWHVSEIAVALTVVKKNIASDTNPLSDLPGGDSGSLPVDSGIQQVRPEKKPDLTMIYRMRAAAPPWMRAVFSAPINMDLAPGDEWHWAIVQAKGYPPQNLAGGMQQATSVSGGPPVVQPASASLPALPQEPAVSIPQEQR